MRFRHRTSKLYSFALAAVFALVLAGCGGGGGSATAPVDPMPTPQETCEAGGGRVESDGSCTTAAELIAEAAQMACEGAGGRYEADGTPVSERALRRRASVSLRPVS